MSPKARNILFWSGLLFYGASFFLVAIANFRDPFRGWRCAGEAEIIAIIVVHEFLRGVPAVFPLIESFSILVAALINPVFLTYVIVSLFRHGDRRFLFYRISVPLMIPFCWVIFYYQNYSAREGHYLWVLGVLLVVISGPRIKAQVDPSARTSDP